MGGRVMNTRTRKLLLNILKWAVLIVVMLFLLFPIYWVVLTSFKTNMESYLYPPTFLPQAPTLDGFINLFTNYPEFFVYYKNNIIVSAAATVLVCFIAIFSGYALSRIKINWSKYAIAFLLFSQMFPVVSRLISLYGLLRGVGLLNTMTGLVLAITAGQLPFSITLMASFFDAVPMDLEEAAYIDGSSRVSTMFKVVIPLVVPGLLAVGIYSFLQTWDDYLYASTLIQNDALRTLSTGVTLRYLGELSYDWSLVNSISVVGTLPMVFVFFFFQKYMIKGLTAGAVKG